MQQQQKPQQQNQQQQQKSRRPRDESRPDLTGDWIFAFEGTAHGWHVDGTWAHTPDSTDEHGEELEIVVAAGRETLNGWSLLGRSNDGNLLLWEDSESFERVVWVRCGHIMESALDTMDENVTISVEDVATGSQLCSLIADKTWLVADLMEAIQDQIGLHPRDQKLAVDGQTLSREDEPLIGLISVISSETPFVVYAKMPAVAKRPSASSIDFDMAWNENIVEADDTEDALQDTWTATEGLSGGAARDAGEGAWNAPQDQCSSHAGKAVAAWDPADTAEDTLAPAEQSAGTTWEAGQRAFKASLQQHDDSDSDGACDF